MPKTILIVDDQEKILKSLARNLKKLDYAVHCAQNASEALSVCATVKPNLMLLDVMLGKENGIDLLSELRTLYPELPVIMITGHGTIERAVEAVKRGACDFLEKPLLFNKLLITIERIFELQDVKEENNKFKALNTSNFITSDPATNDILCRGKRLAATEIPILLYGESGTGKEVLTQDLHASSARRNAPLIHINCASIPKNLLDNELFGHKKGAFTGATDNYCGVFEKADRGTLHLDEIADMSLETQAKILRVLESGEYKRIGEQQTRHANIRFIASTNIDLEQRVQDGLFRQDLLFRLNAAVIRIPPLRERPSDIILITDNFLQKKSLLLHKELTLAPEVTELFRQHPWCGNVRELRNAIDYASAVATSRTINLTDLPESMFYDCHSATEQQQQHTPQTTAASATNRTRRLRLTPVGEREQIIAALKAARYNKKRAAENLNISRRSLYNKIAKHNIEL